MKLLAVTALALICVESSSFIEYLGYENFWKLRASKDLELPDSYQGLRLDTLLDECSDLSLELTEIKCAVVSSYLINKLAEDTVDDELFDNIAEFRHLLLNNAKHDTTRRFLSERSYVQLGNDIMTRLGKVFLDESKPALRLSEYIELIKEDSEASDWIIAFLRVKDIENDPTPADELREMFHHIFSKATYFETPTRYDVRSMSVRSAMVRAGLGQYFQHHDIFWSSFAAICPNRSKSNCYAQHRYFGPLIAWKIASAEELYNYVVIEVDPPSDFDSNHPSKTNQSFTLEIDAKFLGSEYTEAELETYALSVWDRLSPRKISLGLISRSFCFKPRSGEFCDIEFLPRRVVGALLQSTEWNKKFESAILENNVAFAYRAGALIGKATQLGLALDGENTTYLKYFQRCIAEEEMVTRFDLKFKAGLELALRLKNLKYVSNKILKELFYERATVNDIRYLLDDADDSAFEIASYILKVVDKVEGGRSLLLNSLYGSSAVCPYTVASKSLLIMAEDSNQSAVSKSTKNFLAKLLGTSAADALRPAKFYQTGPSHLVHAMGTPSIVLQFKTADKNQFESSLMALVLGDADHKVQQERSFVGYDGAGPLTAVFDICSEIRRLDTALAEAEAIHGPVEMLPEEILVRWTIKTEYLVVHYVSGFHHLRCDDEIVQRFERIKTKRDKIFVSCKNGTRTCEDELYYMLNTASASLTKALMLRHNQELESLFDFYPSSSDSPSIDPSSLISMLQKNQDPSAWWAVMALVRLEFLSDTSKEEVIKKINQFKMQEFLFLLPTLTFNRMEFKARWDKNTVQAFIYAKLIDLEYFRAFLINAAKEKPENYLLIRNQGLISDVLLRNPALVNESDWIEEYELKLLSNTQSIQDLINSDSQALDSKAQNKLCTLGIFFGASKAYSFPISVELTSIVLDDLVVWLKFGTVSLNKNKAVILSCANNFYRTSYWKHLDLRYIRSNALIVTSLFGKNILLKPQESLPWTLNLKEISLTKEHKEIGKAFWQALEHQIDADIGTFLSPNLMVKLPGTGVDRGGLTRQFFDVILEYIYDDALRLGPGGYVPDIFLSTDAAFKLGLLIGKVLQMELTLPRKIDPKLLRLSVYCNDHALRAYYRNMYPLVLENSVKESLDGLQAVYAVAETEKEQQFKFKFVSKSGKGYLRDYRNTNPTTASLRSITKTSDYLSLGFHEDEDFATIDSWSELQKYKPYLFDLGEEFFLPAIKSFRKGLKRFLRLRLISDVRYVELLFRKPITATEFIALLSWEGNHKQLIPSLLLDSNSKPVLISISQAFESVMSVLNSDEIYEMVNMFTGSGKTSLGTLQLKRLTIALKEAPYIYIIPDFASENFTGSSRLKDPYNYKGIVALFNKVAAVQQTLFSEKLTPIAFVPPKQIGLFFAHTCSFQIDYGLEESSSLSMLLSIIYELGSKSSLHFSESLS